MDNAELRSTAYHEAGHAVVALALDLAVDHVTIVADEEEESLGVCTQTSVVGYEATGTRERRAIARSMILSSYAGIHAQRLVDPNPAEGHGAFDEANVFELSREYGVMPRGRSHVGDDYHLAYLEKLCKEAGRLVTRHRRAIAALAEELLRRQELRGEEVEQIVRPLLAVPPLRLRWK